MNEKVDVVLVNPGDRKQAYQDLGNELAAIEPPFWITVIAAFLKTMGLMSELLMQMRKIFHLTKLPQWLTVLINIGCRYCLWLTSVGLYAKYDNCRKDLQVNTR